MDYGKLKSSVRKLAMSDEAKERIIRNYQEKTSYESEEITMNRSKTGTWRKKSIFAAAVIALCLCFAAAAAAAGHAGFFRDVTDWKGAVVGTQYEQASDEIEVAVIPAEKAITVCAAAVDPSSAPYLYLDTLGIADYTITDVSGNTVAEGKQTEMAELTDGKAEIAIPLDNIGNGDYKLVIKAFVGGSKADQPLPISGTWECDFSL